MSTEVLLVRDGAGYRVIFGHLRVATAMNTSTELPVNIKGNGHGVILLTDEGIRVDVGGRQLPLLIG